MRFTPLDTTRPIDTADLAEAYNALHNCVHDGFERVGGKIDDMAKVVQHDRHQARNRDMAQDLRQARVEGALGIGLNQAAIAAGVHPPPVKTKLAGVSRLTALLALVGAAVSAAGAYRYLFPTLEAAVTTLHRTLMGG